jgi:hypothetical protein
VPPEDGGGDLGSVFMVTENQAPAWRTALEKAAE